MGGASSASIGKDTVALVDVPAGLDRRVGECAVVGPSAPPVSMDSPFGDAQPEEVSARTTTGRCETIPTAINSRAGRYLNRRASAPARQVTNQELYRLSRLRDVGDVAQLVLQFGEYRGATLFQVAQSDPDYLRSLALTAQRPQVRAAAIQLVRALEASQHSPGRRRRRKD
jgi:hypothetical protein